MSKQKYLLVSIPSSVTPSGHKDDALGSLQKAVNPSNGGVQPFSIPEFKIGTLDACLQQSDELAKLEGVCNSVVAKVADTLKNVLEGDEEKAATHKNVNDSMSNHGNTAITHLLTGSTEPLEQYLSNFSWNKVKYRADKPISELISLLQKVRPFPPCSRLAR